MSCVNIIREILDRAEKPLSVAEIVQRAGKHLPTRSRTPRNVVARDLAKNINEEGGESFFVRTEPGRYRTRQNGERDAG